MVFLTKLTSLLWLIYSVVTFFVVGKTNLYLIRDFSRPNTPLRLTNTTMTPTMTSITTSTTIKTTISSTSTTTSTTTTTTTTQFSTLKTQAYNRTFKLKAGPPKLIKLSRTFNSLCNSNPCLVRMVHCLNKL